MRKAIRKDSLIFFFEGINMTIEQKLKLWYPADVLQPATPYIYFNSLERTETGRYIYNTVKPYYSKSLGEASISGA